MQIRPVTETDIPLLRDLARRVWDGSYREMLTGPQIEYMLAWMYSEEALLRDLRDGIRYELLLQEDEPAGFLACGPEAGGDWKLHKLYVLPAMQGRGIGQHALRHAGGLAVACGARRLSLNVNKHNARAIRAYERGGFRRVASVVQDIGGGFVMDDYVMCRELP